MRSRVKALLLALLAPLGLRAQKPSHPQRSIDPIVRVIDQPLNVTNEVIGKLKSQRANSKFASLPGVDTRAERLRLSRVADELLDRLIAGVQKNPTKLWVMKQFQSTLVQVEYEDTEAREEFGDFLWVIMQALGIQSSDGLLAAYL
jgi:hypothetical protein